jgi:hypothetical protein
MILILPEENMILNLAKEKISILQDILLILSIMTMFVPKIESNSIMPIVKLHTQTTDIRTMATENLHTQTIIIPITSLEMRA